MKTQLVVFAVVIAVASVALQPGSAHADRAEISIELEGVADGLMAPVYLAVPSVGSGHALIIDQAGFIRVVKDGELLPAPFFDLTTETPVPNAFLGEPGVLGLAFHPNHASNGRFFIKQRAPCAGDPDRSGERLSRGG